jgi:indolepyruvate ferredoxin oxidoreductase
VRIAAGGANLVLGCDMVVAASPAALSRIEQGVTKAVINAYVQPTASFVLNNDIDFEAHVMMRSIREAAGTQAAEFVDATGLATAILGDSIATNLFMLGYAWQKGLLPLSLAALQRAIELNGVAVDTSLRTFNWGRLAAHDPAAVEAVARPQMREENLPQPTLDELIKRRVELLTQYQDAAYAERYRAVVGKVIAAETEKTKGRSGLAEAVATSLYKLMAYKDEYEVARLYTDGAFLRKLNQQFEGDFKLKFNLAPPLVADRDPNTGHLVKGEYGPWVFTMFKLLAKLKGLRGTRLDIFGYTEERKTERRLIGAYIDTITDVIGALSPQNHAMAVQIAALPDQIRGFGHVKEKNLEKVKEREANLLAAFRKPAAPPALAAE